MKIGLGNHTIHLLTDTEHASLWAAVVECRDLRQSKDILIAKLTGLEHRCQTHEIEIDVLTAALNASEELTKQLTVENKTLGDELTKVALSMPAIFDSAFPSGKQFAHPGPKKRTNKKLTLTGESANEPG